MTDIASLSDRELSAAAILYLARTGRATPSIAATLRLDRNTIIQTARELLPPDTLRKQGRKQSGEDEITRVHRLYAEGNTYTEISAATGRPHGTIATWVRAGIAAGLIQRRTDP